MDSIAHHTAEYDSHLSALHIVLFFFEYLIIPIGLPLILYVIYKIAKVDSHEASMRNRLLESGLEFITVSITVTISLLLRGLEKAYKMPIFLILFGCYLGMQFILLGRYFYVKSNMPAEYEKVEYDEKTLKEYEHKLLGLQLAFYCVCIIFAGIYTDYIMIHSEGHFIYSPWIDIAGLLVILVISFMCFRRYLYRELYTSYVFDMKIHQLNYQFNDIGYNKADVFSKYRKAVGLLVGKERKQSNERMLERLRIQLRDQS